MLVVANRIPVAEGQEAAFIERFEEQSEGIRDRPGFQGVELLSPVDADYHVIQAYWDSREAFEQWRNSRDFEEAHADIPDELFDGDNQLEIYERKLEIRGSASSSP